MTTKYKLILNEKSCLGSLSLTDSGQKNSRLKQTAEREARNGYILDTRTVKHFVEFDITTVLGDIAAGNSDFISSIKSVVSKPERYAHIEEALKDYFAEQDYSVRKIEQILGRYGAAFGENGKDGITVYSCSDLQQAVFSILHFLIVNGFKFSFCEHCGRQYATKSLKVIYCNRKSTFSGYERYSCGEAVTKIKDSLEKRRKTVYERLRVRADEYLYSSKYGEQLRDFQNKCTEYKAIIKKAASVSNLQEYSSYLQNGDGLPKRYERIKERTL